MGHPIRIVPIGIVRRQDETVWIEIEKALVEGLLGLEAFSHITVLYWFHNNDTPQHRATLQVHPRKNRANPLTGVFATHSPMRPNLIALSICKILSIEDNKIYIEGIDALDDSPVLDIKSFRPSEHPSHVHVPDWAVHS